MTSGDDASTVTIACAKCGTWAAVHPDVGAFTCGACYLTTAAATCPTCRYDDTLYFTEQLVGNTDPQRLAHVSFYGGTCRMCLRQHKGHVRRLTTFGRVAAQQAQFGVAAGWPGSTRILGSTVVSSTDPGLAADARVVLAWSPGMLTISHAAAGAMPGHQVRMAVADLAVVEISGQGLVTSGGGYSGGGFGAVGAAAGMLAADVANALTTRHHVDTVMRLADSTTMLTLRQRALTPDQLRDKLAPLEMQLREAAAQRTSDTRGPADRLRKADDLLQQGLISPDEHARLRAEILTRLAGG